MITDTQVAVEVAGVGKSYQNLVALKDVDFHIKRGECFGILGPNGAGKSTLIKIIYGVVQRSAGSISVLGHDPQLQSRILRHKIGVVMQEDALDEAMTVKDNMLMFCKFHGIDSIHAKRRVDDLLEYMALSGKAEAKIAELSGGMRRRLAFVRALLPEPQLLILDEPTTGLDPAVRHSLWDKIVELKKMGTTTILTTHYMDEAELLTDRIVIMDQGTIKAQGTPKVLIKEHCAGFVVISHKSESSTTVGVRKEFTSLEELTGHIKNSVIPPDVIRPSNLEDVFLKLTGRELSENA